MNMNAVGIDVSKGKSMVAILRPFGEIVSTPFEVKHTVSGIRSLIEHIKAIDGESRIVMEHTGRYYEPLVRELSQADLFVSAVNPKLIKDFGDNSLRKVKSDKADAVKIARYTLDSWSELRQYSLMDEIRNQLKTMNRQFDFYMKHKTAMKNNLIGVLDQTYPVQIPILTVPPVRTEARSGLILQPPIGMWIVFASCLLTHLSTTIKSGANVESTTSASQKLLKSMKHLRRSFLYFQKTI